MSFCYRNRSPTGRKKDSSSLAQQGLSANTLTKGLEQIKTSKICPDHPCLVMFYEEWGLERGLHKGACSTTASKIKNKLLLRLLLVLEILILGLCSRHRWSGNKRDLAVTAVHLSGLAVRHSEWQKKGFIGMWASETAKGSTPQEEVMPFMETGRTSKGVTGLGELGDLSSTTPAEPEHSWAPHNADLTFFEPLLWGKPTNSLCKSNLRQRILYPDYTIIQLSFCWRPFLE